MLTKIYYYVIFFMKIIGFFVTDGTADNCMEAKNLFNADRLGSLINQIGLPLFNLKG